MSANATAAEFAEADPPLSRRMTEDGDARPCHLLPSLPRVSAEGGEAKSRAGWGKVHAPGFPFVPAQAGTQAGLAVHSVIPPRGTSSSVIPRRGAAETGGSLSTRTPNAKCVEADPPLSQRMTEEVNAVPCRLPPLRSAGRVGRPKAEPGGAAFFTFVRSARRLIPRGNRRSYCGDQGPPVDDHSLDFDRLATRSATWRNFFCVSLSNACNFTSPHEIFIQSR